MAKYHGLVISDIHVGARSMDKEALHTEYLELFIDRIYSMKELDFVIVAGDFFDHKFYLGDESSKLAYIMLKELSFACKSKNAKLRLVYGTESHECNQYDILSLLKIYPDIEVIKYVEEEELLPDLHVLYIPEEHIYNKEEYYNEFFQNKNKYDYIFGHGVIREVMKEIVVIDNDKKQSSKYRKVPIFSSSELSYCCKGQIYFGHYHINEEYKNKIFSISSFSRWMFGEEGRKGFYEITCDTKKEKYNQVFFENTMADAYKTIYFGYEHQIFENKSTLYDTLDGIDKLLKREPNQHIRFIFNLPEDIENPESTINYIKERYNNKKEIKIDFVNGYIEKKLQEKKEIVKNDIEKYEFIFDRNMSIEEKISRYISVSYDKSLSADKIIKYLTKSLKEILESEEFKNE